MMGCWCTLVRIWRNTWTHQARCSLLNMRHMGTIVGGKISRRWQHAEPEASTRKPTAKLILFGGRKFVEGNVTGHVY